MTSNRDLAPTLLPDTPAAVLVAERSLPAAVSRRTRRVRLSRAVGRAARCSYSAGGREAPAVGRLVVTPVLGMSGGARPAPIDSIAVHSTNPSDPAPTVLRYRRDAQLTGGRASGYYAGPAKGVLARLALVSSVST